MFAQSLIPHISLIGITNDSIEKLCPMESTKSWICMGKNDKDIEDGSFILLDNNTKLLRSGGLLKNKYTATAAICDLHQTKINWHPLPGLNYRRHGHRSLCINLCNKQNIINIGGFDSKGKTITKSEIISIDCMQSHIQNSANDEIEEKSAVNKKCWNIIEAIELPVGIADFGECYDAMNDRIYICGGLDSQFRSTSNCGMCDLKTNKWISLPKLTHRRHCNQTQLLHSQNPNILMTFGGWTGISRTSIEILDLRSNLRKWQSNTNNNPNILNYPHSCSASTVKSIGIENGKNKNIQQQLNGLNINNKPHKKDENVVLVCGHRQGLFIETNVIEAWELRMRKWQTIAQFKCAKNHNIHQNLTNMNINTNNNSLRSKQFRMLKFL